MFRIIFFVCFFLCLNVNALSQNRIFAQKTIDTLASPFFSGRGYINNGDLLAAQFINESYKTFGLRTFKKDDFFYPFTFPVNTFPKACSVKIDGKPLIAGLDYIVNPGCPSIKKSFKLKTHQTINYAKHTRKIALVLDTSYKATALENEKSAKIELKVNLQKKLTWSVSTRQEKYASIDILKTAFPLNAKKIRVNITTSLVEHNANNVLGYIEGTEIKDTFIVLTAHYDHLGMMGKTIFPGANDNASGVAMMLDMANYFSKNPCKYSIAFIAFAGEEAGLIGSKHYTDNPWDELPLQKIKFLINLDLMGSGEKGMAVVNATIFPDYFTKLQEANGLIDKKYLPAFKSRGKAANSDHYWFVERGVKGFFFYLMGNYTHYHDINDAPKNMILGDYYSKSFLLIRDFILLI